MHILITCPHMTPLQCGCKKDLDLIQCTTINCTNNSHGTGCEPISPEQPLWAWLLYRPIIYYCSRLDSKTTTMLRSVLPYHPHYNVLRFSALTAQQLLLHCTYKDFRAKHCKLQVFSFPVMRQAKYHCIPDMLPCLDPQCFSQNLGMNINYAW